jgi:hypothetical protein
MKSLKPSLDNEKLKKAVKSKDLGEDGLKGIKDWRGFVSLDKN